MAEQGVRVACSNLPLIGERGADIRSNLVQLSDQMVAGLQPDASVFGISVQRLAIVEARYSPEIAASMLMKQSAGAIVAARKEIVTGALSIVNDALGHYSAMSVVARRLCQCSPRNLHPLTRNFFNAHPYLIRTGRMTERSA